MKFRTIAVLFAALLLLCSCGGGYARHERAFFAMDTLFTVTLPKNLNANKTAKNIEAKITELDADLSLYNPDGSIITNPYRPKAAECISIAQNVSMATGGYYDPLLGDFTTLWAASAKSDTMPSDEIFSEVCYRNAVGGRSYDLGGIGKGYAIDRAHDILREAKISNALVSATSSLIAIGTNPSGKPWRVALRDCYGEVCGYLELSDKALSVSGNYERYYQIGGVRYSHIIDPFTGRPCDTDVLSAAVIMDASLPDACALTDALSTALMVMGKDRALEFHAGGVYQFEMILFIKSEDYENTGKYDIIDTGTLLKPLTN